MIAELLEYNEWANDRALESLRGSGEDSNALNLMAHILTAEKIWLLRLQGKDTVGVDKSPKLTLTECEALAKLNHQELLGVVRGRGDSDLEGKINYRNLSGKEFDSSIKDIVMHVIFHGSYHRGQIARALRAEGAEPASTDYINFTREKS